MLFRSEVRGKYAEKTVKSEIGQRNAAASASYASAQSSLANAKKLIAQAKTEDETRTARRSLLEANAAVANAKWQKMMGNPEDARQGAVHGIAVIDKLLDPKRKDDIQQIFGQIGTSAKGEFKMGDVVTIEECKPISKTKAWRVAALVEKARVI